MKIPTPVDQLVFQKVVEAAKINVVAPKIAIPSSPVVTVVTPTPIPKIVAIAPASAQSPLTVNHLLIGVAIGIAVMGLIYLWKKHREDLAKESI